jgi:hypothetical protein
MASRSSRFKVSHLIQGYYYGPQMINPSILIQNTMNTIRTISLLAVLLSAAPMVEADWWGDNGDTADVEDIDSGEKPETTTDDDLIRDAQGPGQPQDDNSSQRTPVIYDSWGRPYGYGMPYGYGYGFGYGNGYMAGPMVGRGGGGRR